MRAIDPVDLRLKRRSRHDSCHNQRLRQITNQSVGAAGDTSPSGDEGSVQARLMPLSGRSPLTWTPPPAGVSVPESPDSPKGAKQGEWSPFEIDALMATASCTGRRTLLTPSTPTRIAQRPRLTWAFLHSTSHNRSPFSVGAEKTRSWLLLPIPSKR